MPAQTPGTESSLPPVRLRLPATSANLGPGFDTLGLALSLYLTVEARQSEVFHITATGRDAEVCGALTNNLLLMTYNELLAHLGLAAPPLDLRLHNEIPLGMGCGSSAAALLAGIFLANHFGQLHWSHQQILDEACRREGHPDNVGACLFGGMTSSLMIQTTSVDPEPISVTATCGHDLDWQLFLALPKGGLETSKARAVLPASYSRVDAIANIQSTALLVAAFALNRPDLLRGAMRDRLHQPFRQTICPLLPALLPLSGQHGVEGVALSGAGPSVLLIARREVPAPSILRLIRSSAGDQLAEILVTGVGEPAELLPGPSSNHQVIG